MNRMKGTRYRKALDQNKYVNAANSLEEVFFPPKKYLTPPYFPRPDFIPFRIKRTRSASC